MEIIMKRFFVFSMAFALTASLGVLNFSNSFALDSSNSRYSILSEKSDDKVYDEIRLELKKNGISQETQDKLITKLKNGEKWDSMNPEKLKEIPKDYFKLNNKTSETKRYVFSDGSFIEQSVEITPVYSLRSVDGGDISNGTGYHNVKGAKVHVNKGFVSLGFMADYTLVNNADDSIDNVYGEWIKVIGGTYSDRNLRIVSSKEGVNGPAKAELTGDVSYGGNIVAAGTERLNLFVGSDKAWTETN